MPLLLVSNKAVSVPLSPGAVESPAHGTRHTTHEAIPYQWVYFFPQ
jgi:hypothetical protein